MSQFKYCPLFWMFHSRETNRIINKLHERALRLLYNDYNYNSTFGTSLQKGNTFSIRHPIHENIGCLLLEFFKSIYGVTGNEILKKYSQTDLRVPSVNSNYEGLNLLRYCSAVIWPFLPVNLQNVKLLSEFNLFIRKLIPSDCRRILCETYVDDFVFVYVCICPVWCQVLRGYTI